MIGKVNGDNGDHLKTVVSQAKNELVKWIVGGVIINSLVAALLKYAC